VGRIAMLKYDSVQELINQAIESNSKISDLVIVDQAEQLNCSTQEIIEKMARNVEVMKDAIFDSLKTSRKSPTGLSGGDAFKLNKAIQSGKSFGGAILDNVLIKALAIAESNACMGRVVAAPTAGSCGILPAVLLAAVEDKKISYNHMIMGMFTAAAIGMVIAHRATISGAEGGCQAECGSASAMAASALVEAMGGTPQMVGHACAIALKNALGLVCDPVAGLVEVPCIKRNAMGAANALVAAELALAGIESLIPVDEVIDVMREVGRMIAPSLRETGEGGLAATPTAKKLTQEIFRDI